MCEAVSLLEMDKESMHVIGDAQEICWIVSYLCLLSDQKPILEIIWLLLVSEKHTISLCFACAYLNFNTNYHISEAMEDVVFVSFCLVFQSSDQKACRSAEE